MMEEEVNEVEIMCRICHGFADQETLISPCLCKGSMRYVHLSCLNQWRHTNLDNDKFSKCETCQYNYQLEHRGALSAFFASKLCLWILSVSLFLFLILTAGFLGKYVTVKLMEVEHDNQAKIFSKYLHDYNANNTNQNASPRILTIPNTRKKIRRETYYKSKIVNSQVQDTCNNENSATENGVEEINIDKLEENLQRMKRWISYWHQRFFTVDVLHILMGSIALSFFGIFHLITFWRAYFDWFTDNVILNGNVAATVDTTTVYNTVETYLFAIFVGLGLLKSFVTFHRLMGWLMIKISKWRGDCDRVLNYGSNHSIKATNLNTRPKKIIPSCQ